MTDVVEAPAAARIRRGLGWGLSGNIVLRVGTLATSILMARLIAPEQFGVFAVALTVWTILHTLAEFGLGADLVRATDLERRAPTVATIGLLAGGLLALSMALAAGPIADSFRSPESVGVIRLMALSIAIFGFSIVPAARLQRAYRQRALLVVNGLGLSCSAITMTLLALAGSGPVALAAGQIANQVVVAVGLFIATRTRPRFGFDPQIARTSIAFCLPLALANVLSWALLSIDNLVVARVLGPTELGFYVLAFNVSSWPMSLVGQALRMVALPAFSQVEDAGARNRALVRSAAPVVAIAALMALGLATLAGPVVHVLYGARWDAAASALTGLAVFGGIRVVLDLMATFLVAVGATSALLVVQVLWLLAMVPAMVIGTRVAGLAGAGWAHVVVAAVVVVPMYVVCLARVGVDPRAFLRAWLVPLLVLPPAVVACVWIAGRSAPDVLLLGLGGIAALLLYAAPLGRWWLRQIDLLRSPELPMLEEGHAR